MVMRPSWLLGPVVLVQLLPGCYQRSPWGKCAFGGCLDETSDTEGALGTAGPSYPSVMTTTWESTGEPTGTATDSTTGTSAGAGTDAETTTGQAELGPPVIAGMTLTPNPVKSAAAVMVQVTLEGEGAETVTLAVDDGEPAELSPVGDDGTLFTGEIMVFGQSWNGAHNIVALAARGEMVSDPWSEWLTVEAPAAGSEAWLEKSPLVPSYDNAVDVDAHGDVIELLTHPTPNGQRCFLRRRTKNGVPAWPGDTREIAQGEDCSGEDVKFAPDGSIWALVNTIKNGFARWQLWHLDAHGSPLAPTPQVGSLTHLGRGLDVNEAGDVLLCGTWPGAGDDEDAWVRYQPVGNEGWTVPWDYLSPVIKKEHKFSERTQDCAFVHDRIVVVGDAWGPHEKHNNVPDELSRGFVVEFGLAGTELASIVNPSTLAWHSSNRAVAPDDDGGYVVAGHNCAAMVTPCPNTEGVLRWFSVGATQVQMQAVTATRYVYDVTHSPAGYAVLAAQATKGEQGFLVQGWSRGTFEPLLEYKAIKTKFQVATSIAVDRFGFIIAGGYFQEADDTLVAGVVKLHPY